MHVIWLLVRRSFKGLVLFALLLGGLAVIGMLIPGPSNDISQANQQIPIHVIAGAIHTDIAVPATPAVFEKFHRLADAGFQLDRPGVNWIVFGWGSHEFYINTRTWSEIKLGPTLTALTLDRRSVMHVEGAASINTTSPAVMTFEVPETDFIRLLDGIDQTFASADNESGVTLIEGANYTSHDAFFSARGWFTALYGCNAWTSRMLRQIGLTSGIWTPFPQTLLWSLKLHN